MSNFIELNDSESQASNSESSNLRTLELPTELWIPILHEVGNPDRVNLRALPLVCRRLYCLAIPLLYEHISPKPWISEWILPSLVSNSHLQHTTRFEAIVLEGRLYSSISTILSAMKNLQRMSLELLSFNRFPLASIPTLTHFALTSDCPKDTLCSFLSAQPFLEFLELSIPGAPRIKLPENALMNLKTFIGPREILVSIAQGRRIEHFDSECSYTTDFPVAESRHLRSLKDTISICPIMGLLDNIEYLDFTARSTEELESFLDCCSSIPSVKLRCICLGAPQPISLPCARTLFNLFPRLEVVGYITYRYLERDFHHYTRDCDVETQVVVPERGIWDHWWTDLSL